MPSDELTRATRLFYSGHYTEVLRLLEPNIFLYRENSEYYYLLGMACAHTNDLGNAQSYLNRSVQLEPENIKANLGLAAIHVRRRELSFALRVWLRILEIEPRNSIAKRALNLARINQPHGDIMNIVQKKGIGILTGERFHAPKTKLIQYGILCLVVIGLSIGGGIFFRYYTEYPFQNITEERGGSEHLLYAIQVDTLIDHQGTFRYILSPAELQEKIMEIGDYFGNRQDNIVCREINHILNSNASQEIKQRVQLLSEYLVPPNFTNFRDNIDPRNAAREPWLYNDCWVRWKGRVANLNIEETVITFDFLVGYEDSQTLELVIPATIRFATRLDNGGSIEVIGRIADLPMNLDIVSIRLLEG